MQLEDLPKLHENTPDWFDLKKGPDKLFLLFVYDSMQKNMQKSGALKGALYFGKGVTGNQEFLLKESTPNQPVAIHYERLKDKRGFSRSREFLYRVEGEIYGVPLRTIQRLDIINNNTKIFERKKIWVEMTQQSGNAWHNAFMYLGNQDYWTDDKVRQMKLCPNFVVNRDNHSYFR